MRWVWRTGCFALAVIGGWIAATRIDAALSATAADPAAAAAAASDAEAAAAAAAAAAAPDAATDEGLLGTFRMTRYYVAEEKGFKKPRVLASGTGGVTLYDDRGCRPIATVGRRFAEVLDVQGTGKLRDGRVINVSRSCRCGHSPCYRTMGSARWGMSATSKPLEPFRTVAVDPKVIPLGTRLYIAELDGMTMPGRAPWGGFVHDGCVVAADVGGGIDGKHVDFFVGRFAYKKVLDARRKMKRVTVYRAGDRCGSASARDGS